MTWGRNYALSWLGFVARRDYPGPAVSRPRGGEAALAASCLAALSGYGRADAEQALRAMTERATRFKSSHQHL